MLVFFTEYQFKLCNGVLVCQFAYNRALNVVLSSFTLKMHNTNAQQTSRRYQPPLRCSLTNAFQRPLLASRVKQGQKSQNNTTELFSEAEQFGIFLSWWREAPAAGDLKTD